MPVNFALPAEVRVCSETGGDGPSQVPTRLPSRKESDLQKRESRRVGTRRLPYVGDRVGGLGVRPPALDY